MITVNVKGSFKTYVKFDSNQTFCIIPDLILELYCEAENCKHLFTITGVTELHVTETYLRSELKDFFGKFALYFNIPVSEIVISNADFKNETIGVGHAFASIGVETTGVIKIKDNQFENFKLIQGNDINSLLLDFYTSALSDNLVQSYWAIYNILQVLWGDRSIIDMRLRDKKYGLQVLQDDFVSKNKKNNTKPQDVTIFIAIRDVFSHTGKTFGGVEIDLTHEIKRNLGKFRYIARDAIAEDAGISLS